jgi:CBS domain-containing protein
VAAAAYLMKHHGATALVVLAGARSSRPIGIITETDIIRAAADGKDLNKVRIVELMTQSPDRHQLGGEQSVTRRESRCPPFPAPSGGWRRRPNRMADIANIATPCPTRPRHDRPAVRDQQARHDSTACAPSDHGRVGLVHGVAG